MKSFEELSTAKKLNEESGSLKVVIDIVGLNEKSDLEISEKISRSLKSSIKDKFTPSNVQEYLDNQNETRS